MMLPGTIDRVVVCTVRGQYYVRKWPKKRGTPTDPIQLSRIKRFGDANRLAKFVAGGWWKQAIEQAKGTGLYPRDILVQAMLTGQADVAEANGDYISYKEFFLERGVKAGSNTVKDNVMYIHTSYLDGEIEYIPRNILRDYERLKLSDPAKYENIVMGGWLDDPEHIMFPTVDWIKEMPTNCDYDAYGCDFGQTAESAIVHARLKLNNLPGMKHDLYARKLFYMPTNTSKDVCDAMKGLGLDKVNNYIWCDNNMDNESAGIGWVSDLRNYGLNCVSTVKFPGSRAYWISAIKDFNIHIVEDPAFMKEQELFKHRVVDGIQLSEDNGEFDHLWSALGYAVVGNFKQYLFS